MESVNVASVIAMLHQRIKLWAPNYIDTTEFNRIREAVNEALDANSERNKELDALRVALTEKDREIERLKEELDPLIAALAPGEESPLTVARRIKRERQELGGAINRLAQALGWPSIAPDQSFGKQTVDSALDRISASQAREREAREEARINLESAKAEAIDRDAMLARAMQAEAREREAVRTAKIQAEHAGEVEKENLHLESALAAARKALEKIAQSPGDNIGVWCRHTATAALERTNGEGHAE